MANCPSLTSRAFSSLRACAYRVSALKNRNCFRSSTQATSLRWSSHACGCMALFDTVELLPPLRFKGPVRTSNQRFGFEFWVDNPLLIWRHRPGVRHEALVSGSCRTRSHFRVSACCVSGHHAASHLQTYERSMPADETHDHYISRLSSASCRVFC